MERGVPLQNLKRFQAKWKPVRVKKTRQIRNPEHLSILSKRGFGIDPGPRLGIRSVLNDSIPWLTSAAGLLKRSDAPSCDSLWSRVSRARAAADRTAGGGHGRGRAAGGNGRRDGAGGFAANGRGKSAETQGISGSARGG